MRQKKKYCNYGADVKQCACESQIITVLHARFGDCPKQHGPCWEFLACMPGFPRA